MDHAHEQANGGAVGLTENPGTLLRWTVAGPELVQMAQDFKKSIHSVTKEDTCHHEQVPGVQAVFKKNVASLVFTIEEVGNPFEEDREDRYVLDPKVIVGDPVIQTVII